MLVEELLKFQGCFVSTTNCYIAGSFLIPHVGHARLFEIAKSYGWTTHCVINGDDFVLENRGYEPKNDEITRINLMKQLPSVDNAVICRNMKEQKYWLNTIKPEIIIIGQDWLGKDLHKQFCVPEGFFQENGISIMFVPRTKGVSSTELKVKDDKI